MFQKVCGIQEAIFLRKIKAVNEEII
jgi:hypothetical protein